MVYKNFYAILLALVGLPALHQQFCRAESFEKPSRPNIIVIYTDDQGAGDVSALNPDARFKTPNLDRIANEGITFTNAHSSDSVCTPSRYGLLTGRYCWRTSLKNGVMGAEGECLIAEGRMTIASMLADQGYRTGMVGKWHLGIDFPGEPNNRDWSRPARDTPLDRGFDYFYGIPASLNYGILAWFENRHAKVPPTLFTNKKKNRRSTDYRIMPPYEVRREATAERLNQKGFEVAPDFVDNECLQRFTDKAIEWMRERSDRSVSGEPFFLYLPYTSPHYPVCPRPEFHGRGDCGAYGEFLIETDHHVGRILAFLDSAGLDDDTMIFFTSDNGPEKRWKHSLAKYGHDSRGGFREGKRSVYEGGHRVPFFVRWPNGIVAAGRRWDGPIGQVDVLATLAEITRAKLPENAGEDSESFSRVLFEEDLEPEDFKRLPLINHGNGNGGSGGRYSITSGDYKLIRGGKTGEADRVELFQLGSDPSETTNLAATRPEIVDRLTKMLNEIIARGRTTPGPPQPNDTRYWDDLKWMSPAIYDRIANQKR